LGCDFTKSQLLARIQCTSTSNYTINDPNGNTTGHNTTTYCGGISPHHKPTTCKCGTQICSSDITSSKGCTSFKSNSHTAPTTKNFTYLNSNIATTITTTTSCFTTITTTYDIANTNSNTASPCTSKGNTSASTCTCYFATNTGTNTYNSRTCTST
jgi:hypothetical protein